MFGTRKKATPSWANANDAASSACGDDADERRDEMEAEAEAEKRAGESKTAPANVAFFVTAASFGDSGGARVERTATAAAGDARGDIHHRRDRLHPDSIFEQRRYSFSNCVGGGRAPTIARPQQQQRRASYDKQQHQQQLADDCRQLASSQRRASYDVSYLKGASAHVRDEPKSARRDSLVRR